MTRRTLAPFLLIGVAALTAGCATAYSSGSAALRQGHYVEAVERFEEALARDPDRIEALIGLGLARYKLGAMDEAAQALTRAVGRAPGHLTARVYLGLVHLQRAEDGPAEEHLGEAAKLTAGTRTAAQIDRALRVLRGRDLLSSDLRTFIAASIENDVELEREVRQTQAALRDAELRRYPPAYAPLIIRRGSGRSLIVIP